jgi:GrpB-like predicted nucleotidyltransferase (UPF0157 family)
MHAVARSEDELFEQWKTRREREGEHVALHELYDLVADARGVAPEELDLAERERLAARALEVIWPDYEQVAPLRSDGRIEVVPYDASWPERFSELHDRLEGALGVVARRIDHIGSTSVPGLDAKPILDVQVSVCGVDDEAAYAGAIESCGFELCSRDAVHRFFSVAPPAARTAHVHVCEAGGPFEYDHLVFRDYLRSHEEARDAYAEMKLDAARKWHDDRLGYTYAKSDLILDMMERSKQWAQQTGWNVQGCE